MKVIFYQEDNGDFPVVDFMNEQSVKLRARIVRTIELLEADGHMLRMPNSKPLEDGIFELRDHDEEKNSRVLYFFFDGNEAVLTNGFIKKTQKTPRKEIALAKKRRARYLEKKKGGK